MNLPSRLLLIAVAALIALPAAAETQNPSEGSTAQAAAEKARRHERAVERCRQNRGIDCVTPEGLKEWELLERSREEAVTQGSRNLRPVQAVVPKSERSASPASAASSATTPASSSFISPR